MNQEDIEIEIGKIKIIIEEDYRYITRRIHDIYDDMEKIKRNNSISTLIIIILILCVLFICMWKGVVN